MRDEQMDGGSDGPMCSSDRAVKKEIQRQRRQKIGQRCTGEMTLNQQVASGGEGV